MGRFAGGRPPLALLCAVFVVSGCGASLAPDEGPLADLARARQRWELLRPTTYEYVVERICFCPVEWRGPVRVTAVGAAPTAWVYVDTGDPVAGPAAEAFPSVDGLFAIVEDAFESGAHSVQVSYDEASGVPLEIRIDYIELAVDEELGFTIVEQPTER